MRHPDSVLEGLGERVWVQFDARSVAVAHRSECSQVSGVCYPLGSGHACYVAKPCRVCFDLSGWEPRGWQDA